MPRPEPADADVKAAESPIHGRSAPPARSAAGGRDAATGCPMRLDQRLVADGLCESRERAQALILAGEVLVDDRPVTKAGTPIPPQAQLRIRAEVNPYVSRGGLKLRRALDFFGLAVEGCSALDVGASTGGFTDCLLQAGAARVCAVDVGYGQLAHKLRSDPRVSVLERVNARTLSLAELPFQPDLAVCDVSFISQTLVLPRLVEILDSGGPGDRPIITLVKPQFEVERGQVGKGGVVRDPVLHEQAIRRCARAAEALGCRFLGVTPSPLRGPAGNEEFLLYVRTAAARPS
jgi:23S rRNA (cytidine1920-2'-O)/16S rRNA (cytidine1409-2'-O)-methyltransferase